MTQSQLNELTLEDLKHYLPSPINENLVNDMIISHINRSSDYMFLTHPCRFDGYIALLCTKGSFEISINLKTYMVKENSLIVYVPGYICKVSDEIINNPDIEITVLAVSKSFISEMRYDFSRLYDEGTSILDNPCITIGCDDFENLTNYYKLIMNLSNSNLPGTKDTMKTLMSSLFYYMGALWTKESNERKVEIVRTEAEEKKSNRSKLLFEEFLKLVTEYHDSERTVGFYAEKLCLTPKYLSKVIKNVSGRSAPDWIDSFVILEAKNLLKYSDMSIKEIVFKLHFPSQSVFYKFFKAHTGITPSEYRSS